MTESSKKKSTPEVLPLESPEALVTGKPAKKTVRRKTAVASSGLKRTVRKKAVKVEDSSVLEQATLAIVDVPKTKSKSTPVVKIVVEKVPVEKKTVEKVPVEKVQQEVVVPVEKAPVEVITPVVQSEISVQPVSVDAGVPPVEPVKEEISTSDMLRRLHANDNRPRRQDQPRHDQSRRHDQRGGGQQPRRQDQPRRHEQPRYQDQPVRDSVETPAADQPRPEPVYGEGIIEVSGKGFGFLRDPKRNFVQNPLDIFVTPEIVRKFALRDGQWLRGEIRRGGRGPQLHRLLTINGEEADTFKSAPAFEELTTINPNKRIKLETVPERFTTRIMDMMTPLGKGQRGLIVAPPRTGKTTLLEHIADAVAKNHPDMKLIILLVDERPEEVTEIRRSCPTADIMASSNDSDIKSHTRISQLAIERAKRLVEEGKDVFILLDSITRLARAFNNNTGGGGRTMSGGIDSRAMEIPRKLFAAARNTEEAGSLTIVATALIETGSRMDDLIFQEFKGTGNMELVLDRKISDLRIYPAVDIFKSGTRREELLLPADQLHKINVIRRGLSGHKPEEAIERLLMFVRKFPTNTQMLNEIPG